MTRKTPQPQITALRPLVRYVDQQQAVIDVHVTMRGSGHDEHNPHGIDRSVELMMQITGSDGFHDERRTILPLEHGDGTARFEVVEPQRWWPAGMGDQPLYEMVVSLVRDDQMLDRRSVMLGLTSVRADELDSGTDEPHLLVNGEICALRTILPVDSADEHQLLPATGDSLLVVRGHYGPDVLYQAADRAGVLLVQCVPIHPQARPELDVAQHIDRLVAHPSLAGWFVGHLGRLSDRVANRLRELDPTRSVFRTFPMDPAA